jgi:RNA polymerase sigma factor (sigma-70 family)
MQGFGRTRVKASRRDALTGSRQEEGVAIPNLADTDDADLIRSLRRDPASVEEFYRRHVRPLRRYLMRRVGDIDVAADLVAAAFLAAIESADGYDPTRGRPAAWLFGIANNLISAEARRRATETRTVARLGGQHIPAPDDYARVEEQLDAHQRSGPVADVLDNLPTAERELVHLLLHGDCTVSEAARALGIRPATARMRLARARNRLGVRMSEGA